MFATIEITSPGYSFINSTNTFKITVAFSFDPPEISFQKSKILDVSPNNK